MTSGAFRAFLKVMAPLKDSIQPSFSSSSAISTEPEKQWNTPRTAGNSLTMARLSPWASRSWKITGSFSSSASASCRRSTSCCKARGGFSSQ